MEDAFAYVAEGPLGDAHKDVLYGDVWTALAVFRALPAPLQQVVLRMLLSDASLSAAFASAPQHPQVSFAEAFPDEFATARRLRVLIPAVGPAGGPPAAMDARLNPPLRMSLLAGLAGTGAYPAAKKPKLVDEQLLHGRGWSMWEAILGFMVRAPEGEVAPGIKVLLNKAELIKGGDASGEEVEITPNGFQFLLRDVYYQQWVLVREYLKDAMSRNMQPLELLQFLFQLSCCRPGVSYAMASLTQSQRIFCADLSDFGLTFVQLPKDGNVDLVKSFYVTPLGVHLTSCSPERPLLRSSASGDSPSGYVIVETNYRVYAYTDSKLQIGLLNLFVEVRYKLPNLAVGAITRNSILNAFRAGITANQILGYLHQRAHPEMRKNTPVLPETVVDQIRLWEQERNRLAFAPCSVVTLRSKAEFEHARGVAEERGVLLCANDSKLVLVLRPEGREVLAEAGRRRPAAMK